MCVMSRNHKVEIVTEYCGYQRSAIPPFCEGSLQPVMVGWPCDFAGWKEATRVYGFYRQSWRRRIQRLASALSTARWLVAIGITRSRRMSPWMSCSHPRWDYCHRRRCCSDIDIWWHRYWRMSSRDSVSAKSVTEAASSPIRKLLGDRSRSPR